MTGKCATCRWWEDLGGNEGGIGACHVNAPTPSKTPGEYAFFPRLAATNFCGEWKEQGRIPISSIEGVTEAEWRAAKGPTGMLLVEEDGIILSEITSGDLAEINLLRGCELRLRAIKRDYGHRDGGWLDLLDKLRAKRANSTKPV